MVRSKWVISIPEKSLRAAAAILEVRVWDLCWPKDGLAIARGLFSIFTASMLSKVPVSESLKQFVECAEPGCSVSFTTETAPFAWVNNKGIIIFTLQYAYRVGKFIIYEKL